MNPEGSILGKAGDYIEEKSMGVIMVNVWYDYFEIGREVLKQDDLNYIFINTAKSKIVAKRIANLVLLIRADKDTEIGMLKSKANMLNKLLENELKQLEVSCKKENE